MLFIIFINRLDDTFSVICGLGKYKLVSEMGWSARRTYTKQQQLRTGMEKFLLLLLLLFGLENKQAILCKLQELHRNKWHIVWLAAPFCPLSIPTKLQSYKFLNTAQKKTSNFFSHFLRFHGAVIQFVVILDGMRIEKHS